MVGAKGLAKYLVAFVGLSLSAYAELAPSPDVTSGFTNGRLWLKLTAAMQAGITDHVWDISELLA
jgi:hypothetical protein